MANQGGLLPDHPAQRIGHAKNDVLDAARVLMLFGAAAAVSTVANPVADAGQAFLGLVTWLAGVSLLLSVAGRRFPPADALAGIVLHTMTMGLAPIHLARMHQQ